MNTTRTITENVNSHSHSSLSSSKQKTQDRIRVSGIIHSIKYKDQSNNFIVGTFISFTSIEMCREYFKNNDRNERMIEILRNPQSNSSSLSYTSFITKTVNKDPTNTDDDNNKEHEGKHSDNIVFPNNFEKYTIVGLIKYKMDYFYHTIDLQKKWDSKRNQYQYEIIKVIKTELVWDCVCLSLLESIFLLENRMNYQSFKNNCVKWFNCYGIKLFMQLSNKSCKNTHKIDNQAFLSILLKTSQIHGQLKNQIASILVDRKFSDNDDLIGNQIVDWYKQSEYHTFESEKGIRSIIESDITFTKHFLTQSDYKALFEIQDSEHNKNSTKRKREEEEESAHVDKEYKYDKDGNCDDCIVKSKKLKSDNNKIVNIDANDKVYALSDSDKFILIERVSKNPKKSWILTSKNACKEHFPFASFTPVAIDKPSLIMDPFINECLRLYDYLYRVFRKKKKWSTVILEKIHLEKIQYDNYDALIPMLDQLCDMKHYFVKERYGGKFVYTFKKDYDIQNCIVDFYRTLNQRALRHGGCPEKKCKYRQNKALSQEQVSILESLDDPTISFLNIIGLPGRGKSFVITEICKKYKNVAVCTHVASLASKLKNNIDNACGMDAVTVQTIHNAITCSIHGLYKSDEIEILIIDEFEDVSSSLAAKLFNTPDLYPNIIRIVQVFDPAQIRPISRGQPAIDLLKMTLNTKYTCALRTPFRFETNDETDEYDQSLCNVEHNDKMLLTNKQSNLGLLRYDMIELKNIEDLLTYNKETFLFPVKKHGAKGVEEEEIDDKLIEHRPLKDLVFIYEEKEAFSGNLESKAILKKYLNQLRCIMWGQSVEDYNVGTSSINVQCIALTHAFKNEVNTFVESLYNPNPKLIKFYAGQHITIIENNYKRKPLTLACDNHELNVTSESFEESEHISKGRGKGTGRERGRGRGRGKASARTKGDQSDKHTTVYSDRCNNGDTYIIQEFKTYSLTLSRWMDGEKFNTSTLPIKKTTTSYYSKETTQRICIITTTGKIICVHPDFVKVEDIIPAWCITVDRSKGLEFDNVMVVTNPDIDSGCFGLNHIHVALTRAKKRTYVLGTPTVISTFAKSRRKERICFLKARLAKLFNIDHQ